MKNSKVKILISYHKPADILKSEIFEPIHAGRAISHKKSKDGGGATERDLSWFFSTMRGDDRGENISCRNRELNEMTAIYWAWKNLFELGGEDLDYIGHMHYRRIFDFEDVFFSRWERDCRRMYSFDEEFPELVLRTMFQPSDDSVRKKLSGCAALIPRAHSSEFCVGKEGNFSEKYFPVSTVKKYLKILQEKNPTIDVEKYLNSPKRYVWNIFVFRRDIFDDFCRFVFPAVFEFSSKFKDEFLEEKPGLEPMTLRRMPGFFAELSFHIFCSDLIARKNVEVRECGVVQFKEIVPESELKKLPFPFWRIVESSCNRFFRLDAKSRMKHRWRQLNSLEVLKRKIQHL